MLAANRHKISKPWWVFMVERFFLSFLSFAGFCAVCTFLCFNIASALSVFVFDNDCFRMLVGNCQGKGGSGGKGFGCVFCVHS